MQRSLAVAVVAVAVVAACSSEPAPKGPITAEITHYDYTFDLATRAAKATITATVTTAGDCWTLPLRAQGLANVELDHGTPRSVTQSSTEIITCGGGYREGATLVLSVDATVALETVQTSQVGFSVKKDNAGNPFTYMLSWVNGCDEFAPCDSAPDRFATYHFDVTHDASLTVRCPGDVTDMSSTETTCDFTSRGGPTYSTWGIAAYPAWTQTDEGMWGGIHTVVYDRAATKITPAIDPAYHSAYVAWLEQEFGPYPFGSELRVLTAPTYWNGFEHPGNIVLADSLATTFPPPPYANNVAHTLDHEIAHMWAGDQTTLAGTYDFAWKEAMAEYLAYVYEDMTYPQVALQSAGAWKEFATASTYYPVPEDHPPLFDYYTDVYGPGPMILFHQLEVMTSRAQVLAALQSVLGQPSFLSVDQVIAALAQHTGLDLTTYVKGWLEGTGKPAWPLLDVTFTPGASGSPTSSLTTHQTNPGANPQGCMFHVELVDSTGTQTALVAVDTFHNGTEQTLSVPTPSFTVASVKLDPNNECLVFPATTTVARGVARPWIAQPSLQAPLAPAAP